MTMPRFVQLHFLTAFPGVLLNRDDAGLAKRLTYGGAVRTRVSSQCLKRHWRTAADRWSLREIGLPLSVRTREVFEYAIRPRVSDRLPGATPEVIEAAGAALSRALYGKKADAVKNRQALLLGWREVDFLTEVVVRAVEEADSPAAAGTGVEAAFKGKADKANLDVMLKAAAEMGAGLEAALFGRMVTADPKANTDAAIHVAHAFTVHEQESETDYFTVVDDLRAAGEEDAGSAGIFDTELTSGLYYGYVVVDVPLLVANLSGAAPEAWAAAETDRESAAKVVEHLIHLVATVSPGAKKGSTAPYAYASSMLVELGDRQPRTLAAAFEQPVRGGRTGAIGERAEDAMFARLSALDAAYGGGEARRFLSVLGRPRDGAGSPTSLDAMATWAADGVRAAGVS
jgi:CRISPR system Cascade subunit CasC